MSELTLLRALRELFARHGFARKDAEPSAVCPKHRDEIQEDRRLYYEFQRPQRCAICGVEVLAEEATAFDDR